MRISPSFPGGRTVVLSDNCFLVFVFNLVTCLESIPYQYMYICFILFDILFDILWCVGPIISLACPRIFKRKLLS